ncbi:MAG: urea transporter [Bacteroidetes bacterium]|nr:urea transporter [Bacteroidota bacterium]
MKFQNNKSSRFGFLGLTRAFMRGLGQIMLQENAWTGLFFFIGICYGSLEMGLAALLSSVCATLSAWLLGFGRPEIESGLYGYSAALVGVALALFLHLSWLVCLLIIVGAVSAAILQYAFIQIKIPVFTLPFVLLTWLALYLATTFFPDMLRQPIHGSSVSTWAFVFRGFGEVIFQNSILSGILFLIGIAIHSIRSTAFGIAGALLSGLIAYLFHASPDSIAEGIFSYNAVLCAIALSGPKRRDLFWVGGVTLLAVAVQFGMTAYALPVLTFPFVAATMICVRLKSLI